MTDLGYVALILALILAVYGIIVSVTGGLRNRPALVASGRNAIFVVAGLVLLAAVLVWYALLTNQFNLEYVAGHSERSLPTLFKISALWGGQEGSLTFWTLILCGFAIAATWFFRRQQPSLKPWVNAVLLLNIAFFLLVILYAANPFLRLWRIPGGEVATAVFRPSGGVPLIPADGQGLNPQLQNPWMVIHPVFLYLGFIGLTVPFAYAVAALVTGQLGNAWIKLIRKWTLVPWLFLTLGILLGSQWAYIELGWGGYWAWDPVENASFVPWLAATAFIHSIMIQERRGMLKVWNMILIWLAWELTIFGTFMTRSGVVESVHSFALSPIGPLFAVFIISTMIGFLLLLLWRLPLLKSDNQLDSVVSREASFLTFNVLLMVILAATLLGTLFRPISEWVTGDKISLNAPYFERVIGPLFFTILLLMGVCALLGWRRSGLDALKRNLTVPFIVALVSIPILFLLADGSIGGIVGGAALIFVFTGIVQEYVRGVRARRLATGESWTAALLGLFRRNGRRYGGYIVHIGVLLIALGIIGNEFFQSEGQANLARGESITVANYTLTYNVLEADQGPNFTEFAAPMALTRAGRPWGEIRPTKLVYNKNQEQPMTEVGLRPGLIEDVYVVLAGFDSMGETASFKVYVNPLMSWMWIGGMVIALGVMISAWPRKEGLRSEATEAAARLHRVAEQPV
jgi:cytochrome c-type biogenesis protein CcmF